MRKLIAFLLGLSPFFVLPQPVSAHAFGKLYTLPVPFWLYLYGGAATLVVSFLIIGYFVGQSDKDHAYSTKNLSLLNIFTKSWFFTFIRVLNVLLFSLAIVSGLIGKNYPTLNFNMTFFWIIFVLGFTYLTAIFGNIWSVVNPWKTVVEWLESIREKPIVGLIAYPKQLGYYPALLIYFFFIWEELVGKTTPFSLSILLTQYSFINFMSVWLVGKKSWFEYCEFFSVFFRLISKIAPIEYRSGKLYLRPPFIGLLKESPFHLSILLFILFMLSSTAFDGFRETIHWYRIYWQNFSIVPQTLFQTLGLLLSPIVFLTIYLILIFLAKKITKSNLSVKDLSLQFAYSLIPIALVYNLAHYYTLLLTQGQSMVSIISDPFAFGWNLFGTRDYAPNLGVVNANLIWHTQVAFILIGHIAAVYLTHVIALRIFPDRQKAIISQFPMLVLMVAYTMIGLWILSQPITTSA